MSGPLLYPPARWMPVPSHGGAMGAHMGLVEHITTNDFSPHGFFFNPANQASSHLWIALDGSVEQYLSLDVASWAQAGGNYGWTSVEIAGKEGTPKNAAQIASLARLFAWGCALPNLRWSCRASDSPDIGGLGWHGMGGAAWGGHTYCPGRARLAQRPEVLARARAILTPPPMPPKRPPAPIPRPIPTPPRGTEMAQVFLMPDGVQIAVTATGKTKIIDQVHRGWLVAHGLIPNTPPVPLVPGPDTDALTHIPWSAAV